MRETPQKEDASEILHEKCTSEARLSIRDPKL